MNALEKMRAIQKQVEQFEVDLEVCDPGFTLQWTWSAVSDMRDALSADIARLEED